MRYARQTGYCKWNTSASKIRIPTSFHAIAIATWNLKLSRKLITVYFSLIFYSPYLFPPHFLFPLYSMSWVFTSHSGMAFAIMFFTQSVFSRIIARNTGSYFSIQNSMKFPSAFHSSLSPIPKIFFSLLWNFSPFHTTYSFSLSFHFNTL